MKMAWHDLFIYSFKPYISTLPLLAYCMWNCTMEGAWYYSKYIHTPKLFFKSTSTTLSLPSLFSIDHLVLSSINLQNALFKLLINTLIDLQKCHHLEESAVDGSDPIPVQFPSVQKWWMREQMYTTACKAKVMDFGWRCQSELANLLFNMVNTNDIYK